MGVNNGDLVWFFEQFQQTLADVDGYQPIKGTAIRAVFGADNNLATVDVLIQDPLLPAPRTNRVVHNVAYVPAGGVTPKTGYYVVADAGEGTGPAATTVESPPQTIAPPTPNPIKPLSTPFTSVTGLEPGDEEEETEIDESEEESAVEGEGVAASGTVTVTALPVANDTLTIDGTAFTFVANGATGNQINIAGSVNAMATAIAAALTASAVNGVTAASYAASGAVVTITYKTVGANGNAFQISASSAGLTLSGATLSGGVNAVS